MVTLENDKIIIEIKTSSPYEDLQNLQTALIEEMGVSNPIYKEVHENFLYQSSRLICEMIIREDNIQTILNDNLMKRKLTENNFNNGK